MAGLSLRLGMGLQPQAAAGQGGGGGEVRRIAYADFVGGVYELEGEAVTLATLFSGTDPSGFNASGMGVFGGANQPKTTEALRDAMWAELGNGITFIFEMDYGGTFEIGPLAMLYNTEDISSYTYMIGMDSYESELQVYDSDSWYQMGTPWAQIGIDLNGIVRTAICLNRRNGSAFENEVAHNGGFSETFSDFGFDLKTAMGALMNAAIGHQDSWSWSSARFRRVEIWTALDTAALLAKSAEGLPLSLKGTPAPDAMVGIPYSAQVTAWGGRHPFVYSVQAGTLPAGLSLNASTGEISGTPTTTGAQSGIVLRATDADGATADLAAFSITVRDQLAQLTHSSFTSLGFVDEFTKTVELGPADADRMIVLATWVAESNDPAQGLEQLTINGEPATQVVVTSSANSRLTLHYAAVPNGTTGELGFDFVTTGQYFVELFVFAVYGMPISIADEASQVLSVAGLNYSATVHARDDSAVIALWHGNNASEASWSNIEERAALSGGNWRTEAAMSMVDAAASINIGVMASGTAAKGQLAAIAIGEPWPAPENTALPAISGNRWLGATLSVSDGSWNDHGLAITGYSYQWRRNGAAISGATASTYRLLGSDAGATISCTVTATNSKDRSTAATATGVQAVAPTLEFLEGRTSTTAGTITHSNVNFGAEPAAGENRYIIAAIAFSDLSVSRTVTSVTIGGVAATRMVRSDADSSFASAELWIAEVPSGTTGSITAGTVGNRSAIAAYRLTNAVSSEPVYAGTIAASQNGPANLAVEAGDLVLACTAIPSPGDITWTGVTEDYDVSAGSSHQGSTAKAVAASNGILAINSSPLSGRRLAAVAFAGPSGVERVSALKSATFIRPAQMSASAVKAAAFVRPDNEAVSVSAVKTAIFVKPV